jgi:hypothetical protein
MNVKFKVPVWINEGPRDIEYHMYKLRGAVSDLKKKLKDGKLMEALTEIDDTLDYLYRYDAVKMTQDTNVNQIIGGFEFPDLELVFSTAEEPETDDVLDELLDEAIDEFEDLHAICRDQWREIEDGITCNYVPHKPYFLNDGFVFIHTPDNMMHVYHFLKPNKYFAVDWKGFKMNLMYVEKWTDENYYKRIEELISKKDDKLIIKTTVRTNTILEHSVIGVLSQIIYTMLRRDYTF